MQFPRRDTAFPEHDRDGLSLGSANHANRRRLKVFLGVFIATALVGLAYTFLRPAEYRAATRLVITPATRLITTPETDKNTERPVLVEAYVLVSRPLVQRVWTDLQARGLVAENLGADEVGALQSRLTVSPVANTNLVELSAVGTRPETLAPLLNGLVEAYGATLAANFQDSSADALEKLREEARIQGEQVASKRAAVETFRTTRNIVSTERDENDVLARVKGLGTSLSQASDKVSGAEARLRALREAAAAGKVVVRTKDETILAELEQRAASLRERLRDWGRRFTPEFLRYDNDAREMRAQLADTEQRIAATRSGGRQAALSEAEEDLAIARAAADLLRKQAAGDRNMVGAFMTNFNQYKAMQEDLTQLEGVYRATQARLMAQEASEKTRMPAIEVVEAASTPNEPFRPLYARDAAISVGAAVLLGLFTLALVELFNRPEPQSAAPFAKPWIPVGVDMFGRLRMAPVGAPPVESIESRQAPLLSSEASETRELAQHEVAQLLEAGADGIRPLLGLMLCGLTAEEVAELRWDCVDLAARRIRVAGKFARELALPEPLLLSLRERHAASGSDFVADNGNGTPMSADDLRTAVLCAAHDALLKQPSEVTPEALRHTFIVHLVRQGIRFSDLGRVVGQLSAEALTRYGSFAPAGQRLSAEQIDLLVPGLRAIYVAGNVARK